MDFVLEDISPVESVEIELAIAERSDRLREANQPEIALKLRNVAKAIKTQRELALE